MRKRKVESCRYFFAIECLGRKSASVRGCAGIAVVNVYGALKACHSNDFASVIKIEVTGTFGKTFDFQREGVYLFYLLCSLVYCCCCIAI